jgi:hypothetical protein
MEIFETADAGFRFLPKEAWLTQNNEETCAENFQHAVGIHKALIKKHGIEQGRMKAPIRWLLFDCG